MRKDRTPDGNIDKLDPRRNPVDAHRDDINRGVWKRVGDVLHGGVDRGGKVGKWGAEVTETGTDHGKGMARPVGRAIGNVVRGTYELAAGVISGIRGISREHSDKKK